MVTKRFLRLLKFNYFYYDIIKQFRIKSKEAIQKDTEIYYRKLRNSKTNS